MADKPEETEETAETTETEEDGAANWDRMKALVGEVFDEKVGKLGLAEIIEEKLKSWSPPEASPASKNSQPSEEKKEEKPKERYKGFLGKNF